MQNMEQSIRERAYHLWMANGCPEGSADLYWLSAQREILTASVSDGKTGISADSSAAPARKKPAAKPKAATPKAVTATAKTTATKSKRRAA